MKDTKKKMKKIKKFTGLCNIDQEDLKKKLENILSSMGYKDVKNEDGFLYTRGEVPVLLVAHMDTVHEFLPGFIKIEEKNGETILSSPYGIGGDDRCGIYMVLEIIKDLKCSVLFCEDEEIGLIGARAFTKTKYINELDVNYIVEFDRKGSKDAVFYDCDNEDFEKFVTAEFFKTAIGICSDISEVAPASGIAAVNLSCGYYNAHQKTEYVVFEQMLDVIEAAKIMISKEVEEPFEYVERKYSGYGNYGYGYGGWYDDWDYAWGTSKSTKQRFGIVYFNRELGDYDLEVLTAKDEKEATLDFLMWYSDIPYKDILGVYEEEKLEAWGIY